MLDEKRINEANSNFKQYHRDGLIAKWKTNSGIIDIYKRNSQESLEVAQLLLDENKSDLWVIVSSYYSMFYIANAVLLSVGYKVGEKIAHKVTADSLIHLLRNKLTVSILENYEDTQEEALSLAGIKADNLIQSFDYERVKRSNIQYNTLDFIKRSKAVTSIDRAKEFKFEIEKLLQGDS
ncbi:MAG: hypothetical protein KKF44_06670 [Nanoarchaeota archaeon]|nr:hypothetical protein [Nanoarchaeota archaeon]